MDAVTIEVYGIPATGDWYDTVMEDVTTEGGTEWAE
jgi:hypothetical protein